MTIYVSHSDFMGKKLKILEYDFVFWSIYAYFSKVQKAMAWWSKYDLKKENKNLVLESVIVLFFNPRRGKAWIGMLLAVKDMAYLYFSCLSPVSLNIVFSVRLFSAFFLVLPYTGAKK